MRRFCTGIKRRRGVGGNHERMISKCGWRGLCVPCDETDTKGRMGQNSGGSKIHFIHQEKDGTTTRRGLKMELAKKII